MKKIFLFAVILLITAGCSRKQEKFELFSAESFAYSMDKGWEMNGTVRAKGFEQNENNKKFSAKLSYTIDLVTADGNLIKGIESGNVEKTADDKISEIEISTQLILGSNYKTGNCKVIFNVTDELSKQHAMLWSFFELSN
jgi:hypothetical protein